MQMPTEAALALKWLHASWKIDD